MLLQASQIPALCSNDLGRVFGDSTITLLLGFSLMSAFLILALAYAISRIWNDEKVRIWVRQEIWNAVLNGILVLFMLGIIDLFTNSLTNTSNLVGFMSSIIKGSATINNLSNVGGECLYDHSYKYTLFLVGVALEQSAISSWSYLHFIFIRAIRTQTCASDSFLLCLLSAPMVMISPYLNVDWATGLLSTFNRMLLTTVFLFAYSQALLIRLFISSNFTSFLALMVILRLLPFTRSFANVIFALIFAFMIFYPLIVALESFIFGVPDLNNFYPPGRIDSVQASRLANVKYGDSQDLIDYAQGENLYDIWDVVSSGTNIILRYRNSDLISIDEIINAYAYLLFIIVLFGSINFILVALVIREVLRYSGESENLMEMFIRMGGIITW